MKKAGGDDATGHSSVFGKLNGCLDEAVRH